MSVSLIPLRKSSFLSIRYPAATDIDLLYLSKLLFIYLPDRIGGAELLWFGVFDMISLFSWRFTYHPV
jgi:hypothetical protein